MAGEQALAIIVSDRLESAASRIKGYWEIHFSRFFNRVALPSTCPDLVPLTNSARKPRFSGMWLSSTSTASLQLQDYGSITDAVLSVCLNEKILEEHFISNLHFTWPQVSCMSGFRPRGSRAVLASYKDCDGEIHKFALRFLTSCEAEEFMNVLKDTLQGLSGPTEVEVPSSDMASAECSHSEFISPSISPYRCPEAPDTTTSKEAPEIPKILKAETQKFSHHQEPGCNPKAEDALAAFPPSFTSLLASCVPVVEQSKTMTQLNTSQDDLRSQIMMYMEDSSFQEILFKVEQVISEMEAL